MHLTFYLGGEVQLHVQRVPAIWVLVGLITPAVDAQLVAGLRERLEEIRGTE